MSRYQRQLLVKEFGENTQSLLSKTSVLIVGAGGLGFPTASYLAGAGVGFIGIVDNDHVEESNLNRQLAYSISDLGKDKATLLAERLQRQNEQIQVEGIKLRLDDQNAQDIISDFDVVCDCTDNLTSRLQLDKACSELKRPLVYAGVKDWEGMISVLHYKQNIRLQDIFPVIEKINTDQNNENSVVNTSCGVAGSLQANEVIKIITNCDSVLDGKILCFNTHRHVYRTFKLMK
ncbi:HesA/MoeB/ThiF family protein [Carboxylicivirga sp. RSCT41]|uniref:HesA/MoeB/ThiF family protein n=1 Tax=Carboxylicivirga agarovorans TaxID=3417570 RepID=UPI003D3255DF